MEAFLHVLEAIIYAVAETGTIVMELFGIIILLANGIKCFIGWIKRVDNIRLPLAEGISTALQFKMGGEVLRTVVVREWSELGILGAIILLRAIMTLLIHWELKNETAEAELMHEFVVQKDTGKPFE